jgi:hypothetical protein
MKKIILFLMITGFTYSFAQVSEFAKIDKIVNEKFKVIQKKYKKKFPEERQIEIAEINKFRRESYQKALEVLQKDDVQVDLSSLEKNLTKEAIFETGIPSFRMLFAENFDTSSLEGEQGMIKSTLKFLVDEKGRVSNVSAEGIDSYFNQEAVITFYKISEIGKWKPAEKDGVPVKSVFRMPLTMNFD